LCAQEPGRENSSVAEYVVDSKKKKITDGGVRNISLWPGNEGARNICPWPRNEGAAEEIRRQGHRGTKEAASVIKESSNTHGYED
jgi:hypothetical protein